MEIIIHISCRSDLRIATKLTDSRESEFPPTNQNVQLIVKSTIKQTVPLKNLPDVESKREQLKGAFVVQTQDCKDRCVLLFDDLYDSGVTLTEVSKILYEQGRVRHVLVLTLTRTRTGRS